MAFTLKVVAASFISEHRGGQPRNTLQIQDGGSAIQFGYSVRMQRGCDVYRPAQRAVRSPRYLQSMCNTYIDCVPLPWL